MASKTAEQPSGAGLAEFAARLTKTLADENTDGNLVLSPLSIYTALALLVPGARGGTLDELLHVLGVRSCGELEEFVAQVAAEALKDRSGSGGPCVVFASGVWSDYTRPLKPDYRQAVVGTYKAEAKTVDFRNNPEGTRGYINAWAAQATRDLVESVLPPGSIKPTTGVVLGNAIYFKGKWQQPFDKSDTVDKPFHRIDHGVVRVPFMQSRKAQFVAVHDGFKVLKLQYKMADPFSSQASNPNKFTRHSMCILLPDAHDGLRSMVAMIASQPGFLQNHLPHTRIDVGQFRVPKFKLTFHDSLAAILKKLGLQLPFSDDGGMSDMVEDDSSGMPMVVDDLIHKAVIEVNEEGTKAAAVTMSTMQLACARFPPPRVDFVADHPFVYFIVEEKSRAVVFAGHVVDPSKE